MLRWNLEGLLFDPGEGTQRQFIHADIAPTTVTRIFVSHFHGDHCLGLGSMLMRLNLDKVTHPIHCYYPASGKPFFDRLRYGTIYHENINVIEHPVNEEGIVHEDETFKIEAAFLEHGVTNIGWRITEKDQLKFEKDKVKGAGLRGLQMRELQTKGVVEVDGKEIQLCDVAYLRKGDVFAYVVDTRVCENAYRLAEDASLLLCESTYLDEHAHLAEGYYHMTATQAAQMAKKAGVKKLILTHFSARYPESEVFAEEARKVFTESEAAEDLKRFPFPKTDVRLPINPLQAHHKSLEDPE
ncbi:MAG: Ribonuclease Z [Chlamydiia bacterium]|nr:Ribonuclease Z [Chlamydiia bacterium]